jgi:Cu-processing system permease protein
MFLMFQFGDYPIEKLIIVLTALNPIDLARISVLLQLDMTAMLGYTGALFRETFHTSIGVSLTILSLVLWIIMPFMISVIKFKNKDH